MRARLEIILEGKTLDIFVKMSKDSGIEIKELINLYVIKMAYDYSETIEYLGLEKHSQHC